MKRIIKKAEQGGYKGHLNMLPSFIHPSRVEKVAWYIIKSRFDEIIFSHDFCIAYWGREFVCKNCGREKEYEECSLHDLGRAEAWQYHGNLMFLSEDRIKYLEQFI